MSLSNYADLKAAVGTWVNREDMATVIPDFIRLAEARIYRVLRTPAMEVVTSLSISTTTGKANIPSDFLEARDLILEGNSKTIQLTRRPYGEVQANANTNNKSSSVPGDWARVGQEFIVAPFPDAEYTIKLYYYKQLAALSDTNQTNYLTTESPDLVLFGALSEAAIYLKDPEMEAVWERKFAGALAVIQRSADMVEWGGNNFASRA
jgi:hypothetical protein